MDLYDSLEKKEYLKKQSILKKYTKIANDYSTQGFDESSVLDLLLLDGCPKNIARDIASTSANSLPDSYSSSYPPQSFYEIKDYVKNSILNAFFLQALTHHPLS